MPAGSVTSKKLTANVAPDAGHTNISICTVFPRNTYALGRKLKAAGARVEVKTYPGVGHPGILLALGKSFRGNAPALDDIVRFAGG